jgi:hypothetical protein
MEVLLFSIYMSCYLEAEEFNYLNNELMLQKWHA